MIERRIYSRYKHATLLKKWLNAVFDLSLGGLLLFCLFVAYGTLPNRWYHTLYVYSGSMAPTIQAGDVIIISPPPAVPAPGSIVTLLVDNNLVTHRVLDWQANGKFATQGDANIVADEWGRARVSLVGVYRARIPYLGYVLAAFQNLMKVNATGAWFVDREIVVLQASCCVLKQIQNVPTVTPTVTPSPLLMDTPLFSSTLELPSSPLPTPGQIDPPEISLPASTSPTTEPTATPTATPTAEPTTEPTVEPTAEPTTEPTTEPTVEPTAEPTAEPTTEPTTEAIPVP